MSCEERRNQFLQSFGIRVLRYENVDVMRNLEGVSSDIFAGDAEPTQPHCIRHVCSKSYHPVLICP